MKVSSFITGKAINEDELLVHQKQQIFFPLLLELHKTNPKIKETKEIQCPEGVR